MSRAIPVPADWHSVAPGRTEPDLADHYGRCTEVIQRWRREQPVGRTGRGPDRYPRKGRVA